MSRHLLIIANEAVRQKALLWVQKVPIGYSVLFTEPKRTTAQSDRMWAQLSDVATQVKWHGQKLSPEDWKIVFMAGLNQEFRVVPNLAGNGFVNLGRSSSKLSKSEMSDLMDLISAFGALNGVVFGDETEKAA